MKEIVKVPVLPRVNRLAIVFSRVMHCIFLSGVLFLIHSMFFTERTLQGVDAVISLVPGFYLFICGILADPCIYGLYKVSIDPDLYFSNIPQTELNDARYNPRFIAMYVMGCGLIATILLVAMKETSPLLDIAFGLAYVVAATCTALIVYYKRKINT